MILKRLYIWFRSLFFKDVSPKLFEWFDEDTKNDLLHWLDDTDYEYYHEYLENKENLKESQYNIFERSIKQT